MAQILLINEKGHIPGTNNIGDLVAIENDDVYLDPGHHDMFTIINVPGVKKEEVQKNLDALITKPIIMESVDLKAEITCWDDKGTLRRLDKVPKYGINLANLLKEDVETFTNEKIPVEEKMFTLKVRAVDKIAAEPTNKMAPIIKASRGG